LMSLCPSSPTSPFYISFWKTLPLCHQFSQKMTPLECMFWNVRIETTWDIWKPPHLMEMITYSCGSLEIFLYCFYELPSHWLELVDLHKHQIQFEPSSSFFTRLERLSCWGWICHLYSSSTQFKHFDSHSLFCDLVHNLINEPNNQTYKQ
jgi:hypothetical protein